MSPQQTRDDEADGVDPDVVGHCISPAMTIASRHPSLHENSAASVAAEKSMRISYFSAMRLIGQSGSPSGGHQSAPAGNDPLAYVIRYDYLCSCGSLNRANPCDLLN